MPTAVSLWAFLRPLGSLAAVALLCSEIYIQQISEYGGTKMYDRRSIYALNKKIQTPLYFQTPMEI